MSAISDALNMIHRSSFFINQIPFYPIHQYVLVFVFSFILRLTKPEKRSIIISAVLSFIFSFSYLFMYYLMKKSFLFYPSIVELSVIGSIVLIINVIPKIVIDLLSKNILFVFLVQFLSIFSQSRLFIEVIERENNSTLSTCIFVVIIMISPIVIQGLFVFIFKSPSHYVVCRTLVQRFVLSSAIYYILSELSTMKPLFNGFHYILQSICLLFDLIIQIRIDNKVVYYHYDIFMDTFWKDIFVFYPMKIENNKTN